LSLCRCSPTNQPETDYKISKGVVWQKCAACGAKEMIDMNHKLTNYILAQDKKAKKEGKGTTKKDSSKAKKKSKDDSDDDKKKKKDKKKDKKSKKDKKDAEDDGDVGDVDEEKVYLKEALFGKKKDDMGIVSDEDDDDDAVSEAGVDDQGAFGKYCLLAERCDLVS
jgi:translation initiation factor 5